MRPMERKIFNGVRFCKCCHTRMLFQGYDTQTRLGHIMNARQICHECAYWQDKLDYPPDNIEVIGKRCVKIYPFIEDVADLGNSAILGGNGKTRYFYRPSTGELFQSNDVWRVGTVPARFLPSFPPTVVELLKTHYQKLTVHTKKCRARSCLDRYHCYRYDLTVEEQFGPFNPVPKKWKAGSEHCNDFINLDEINNLNDNLTTPL